MTDKDIESGQMRIIGEAKRDLQLMEPADLQVRLGGELFNCRYDHRLGSDPERSGLIRLGKANMTRVLGQAVLLTAARCGRCPRPGVTSSLRSTTACEVVEN